MKKVIILFLVLFCMSACASLRPEGDVQEASAHFKLGVAYLSDNKIQQAFVEFHKAYELDPENKEVLNAIGIVYLLHLEEPARSVEYFEKASKLDRGYSESYNNLGYAYEKLGDYEKAISFYKEALSNPRYPTAEKAFINMGNAYYRLRKYEQAIFFYKEAIKRVPLLSFPYMRLALCYNAMGKYGEAAAAMTQAITLDQVYKGNREMAIDDLNLRRFRARGVEEQDLSDYLEVLKY